VRRIVGENGRDLVVSTRVETAPPITAGRIQRANQERAAEQERQKAVDEIFRNWREEYQISEDAFQSALAEAKRSLPRASFDEQRVAAANLALIDKPMETQLAWVERGRRATGHSKAELRDLLEGKTKDNSTRFEENERYLTLIDAINGLRAVGLTERARRATDAILAAVPDRP
jgi:hypothetical protein